MPIRFPVQARPGLRLVAYASESATGRGYEIVCIFYRRCFSSPHLSKPVLGQGFNVQRLGMKAIFGHCHLEFICILVLVFWFLALS